MKIHNLTFWQSVKISWQKELETGDPKRILLLAIWTVIYTVQLIALWIYVTLRDAVIFALNCVGALVGFRIEVRPRQKSDTE